MVEIGFGTLQPRLGPTKHHKRKNNWKPSTKTSNSHKTSIIQRHWCPIISHDLQLSVRHIFNWFAICAMFCSLKIEKVWSWGSKVAWIWSRFGSSSDLDRIELWVTSKGIIYIQSFCDNSECSLPIASMGQVYLYTPIYHKFQSNIGKCVMDGMGYLQVDIPKAPGFNAFRNENTRWFKSVQIPIHGRWV